MNMKGANNKMSTYQQIYDIFPFNYPVWLQEMLSQPILLTVAIVCFIFLYQRVKIKITNGEININDNQSKIIGLFAVIILILIAKG